MQVENPRLDYLRDLVRDNPRLTDSFKPRLNKYIPHNPTIKQSAFLAVRDRDEVFYGGAAAGGKSDALLMAALEYVDCPNYAGLILRRTFAQLDMPDSILDRAKKWLAPHKDVKWVEKKSRFEFASGAVLQFGYLQFDRDVYQYDGPSYQFIGFDELTQFTEFQYTFMFGRLRRLLDSNIPLRMRGASNPGNVGHIWVLNRFVKHKHPNRLYIPARLEDNQYADIVTYNASLMKLDPITRAQRRWGDWEVSAEGTKFKRGWFTQFVDQAPVQARRVRFWDIAATKDGGDYHVGTRVSIVQSGLIYIEHVVRGQFGPQGMYDTIKSTAKTDGEGVAVRFEQEPGASGKALVHDLVGRLKGYDAKGEPSSTHKQVRWQPLANQCEAGNVIICTGEWNEAWLDEMCAVPQCEHDDQADSASGGFKYLAIDAPQDFGIDVVRRRR